MPSPVIRVKQEEGEEELDELDVRRLPWDQLDEELASKKRAYPRQGRLRADIRSSLPFIEFDSPRASPSGQPAVLEHADDWQGRCSHQQAVGSSNSSIWTGT